MKMNKRLTRLVAAFLFAVILTAGFSVTAFAKTDGEEAEEPIATATPTETPEPTPTPEALTPEGNLTLVDDMTVTDESNKQFITVVTKAGNYFYIVIDRSSDTQNVHFLNMVDEADLMALIEDMETAPSPVTTPEPVEPEPTPAPVVEPEPEESGGLNVGGIAALVLIVVGIGGGAFWFFKIRKPKAQGGTDISEIENFDFEDESEGLIKDPPADKEDAE
jgi:hypothetical protein